MKRNLKSMLAVVFSLLLAAGCASCRGMNTISSEGGKEEIWEEGWKKYADVPVELSWYVNYSWFTTDWGTNVVSKAITEDTGVSIRFITPAGSESEKLNSMISSDTLPDLVTLGWWETQAQDMIQKDMVYALNLLADEYDPYFYQVVDKESADWYTHEDGNLYGYPNSSYTISDYEKYEIYSNQNFLVRKDLYEAIGSPDMSTPEGFINAIRTVTERFPKVDGYSLIPIGCDEFQEYGCNSFDKYLQNFLAVPWEKDNELYDRYTDPDYISWLKVFRKLGEEGYLNDSIFIDRRTQMEEKIAQGRYFCMLYQSSDMLDQQKILYANNPDSIYIAVDGPKNAAGDDPVLPGSGINGWTITFISKNCEHPERAISFLSYLMSEEGQKMIYLGVEGVTYDVIDGKPVRKEEVQELLNTNRREYDRIYGADDTYWMLQDNVMQMQWHKDLPLFESQMQDWTIPYTTYTGQYDIIYEGGTEEEAIFDKISRDWGTTLPKLLLASSEEEFDQILEEFISRREKFGYRKIMEVGTEKMHELKRELGMEQP